MTWVHAKLLQSCLILCDPVDCSLLGSSAMGFSRQEYWNVLPCPSWDLLDPGIKPKPLISPALAGGVSITSTTWEALYITKT